MRVEKVKSPGQSTISLRGISRLWAGDVSRYMIDQGRGFIGLDWISF